MKLFPKLIVIIMVSYILIPSVWAKRDVKEAVVKIYTVYNRHDYYDPWQMVGQTYRNGSGCIISGGRILTNAHVVGDQTFIQVRKAGEAKRYTAQVEIVAHECDLAILRVIDDPFLDIMPVEIGELAEVRDKVAVYGFPKGGDELCITEGVVSRVEHHKYTHSNAYLLACQIDAAINPGSSGGPVIKDDRIVGVAFQAGAGQNIGYMVPAPVIRHFLKDLEDGTYDGIPGLGISWQKMENPDIRRKSGMAENQTGMLVTKIYPDSPARGILQPEDILLSIEDNNVENDGTITFRKGERTSFGYLIQEKYINDTVQFEILRENKIMNIDIKLTKPLNVGRFVPYQLYDAAPTYYILGGLVFEPLTRNFLREWGRGWYSKAPTNLMYHYVYGEPTDDRSEIVVLVKVLADEINAGYHTAKNRVISYVNDVQISTMKDLVKAIEEHEGKYHIIVDEDGYKIVLDKEKVDENSKRILGRYRINSDRSRDLDRW
ncbi:MAG: trypsin-like peptidase domain-containing protein [Desulfobacteraceae bacterium]|nr:trypsin-like peptidase domain-containing protein [Desulfobacteraceae bacterium]